VRNSGGPKLTAWLQTKPIDRYVKSLFGEQNSLVLTSKSITATMATRPRIHLQCEPRNVRGQIASQKVYMLTVMENKCQNQKKSATIRHVVKQTRETMKVSRTWRSLKCSRCSERRHGSDHVKSGSEDYKTRTASIPR